MSVISATMPASSGSAFYVQSTKSLYITVSGEGLSEASGIHLEAVNADGLVYRVVGMLGPPLNPPPPRQSYTQQQHFETTVPLTNPLLPVTIQNTGSPLVIHIRRLSVASTANDEALPSPVTNQFSSTELMSASALTAIYYYNSGKLQLHAAGMKPYAITDIKFNRVSNFAGGLKYRLEGQVPEIGILPVGRELPYSITDEFDMQLPNRVFPSNTVIVKTSDGDRTLNIEYLGFPSSTPEAHSAQATAQSTADKEVLVSAFSLSADYNHRTSMLTLKAEGVKPNNMTHVGLTRDSKFIGLKYLLQGLQSMEPARFFEPYKVEQSFRVDASHTPPKDVVVETAGPKSNNVPINYHWDGTSTVGQQAAASPQTQISSTQSGAATTTTTSAASGNIPLNVLYKVPFEIKWNCNVPSQGTVKIDFDTKYLELQNASILSNQIIWTFNSVSTGYTTIKVTERGGIAQYITGQTWDAKIFLPGIGGVNQPAAEEQAMPSFTALVSQGLNLIKSQYQDAQLLTAELSVPNAIWHSTAGVAILTVTAEVVVNRQFKIATIMTKTPDPTKFGPVALSSPPKAMENMPMRWPVNMDLVEAIRLLQKAGYHQGIADTMLRQPVSAVILSEPYYIFSLRDEMQVGVGVDSKSVKIFKNTTVVSNNVPLTGLSNGISVAPSIAAH